MNKIFLSVFLVLAVFVSPVFVNAQVAQTSAGSQQLLVQMLQQIVAQLQTLLALQQRNQAITPVSPSPRIICPQLLPLEPNWCPLPKRVVSGGADSQGCTLPPRCENDSSLPVINGITGPTTLDIGEEGTWGLDVTAPSNSQLTYRVEWGDEPSYLINTDSSSRVQSTSTFTHVYNSSGMYTVRFTVISDTGIRCITTPCPSGGSAEATITVNVGRGNIEF
jgi:hypothetical protein